jgi:hypothetical protein
VEIAKSLIYNESLFPVIDITGNSGSLLVDLVPECELIAFDRAPPRHSSSKTAIASFHTINLA